MDPRLKEFISKMLDKIIDESMRELEHSQQEKNIHIQNLNNEIQKLSEKVSQAEDLKAILKKENTLIIN